MQEVLIDSERLGTAAALVLIGYGRFGAAAALVLIGAALVIGGVLRLPRRTDPHRTWPEWALTYLYVFRLVVVGACLGGAGIGLAEQIQWLLAASVCIGLGELLESSYYIGVLHWGRTQGHPDAGVLHSGRTRGHTGAGVLHWGRTHGHTGARTSRHSRTSQLRTTPLSTNGSC